MGMFVSNPFPNFQTMNANEIEALSWDVSEMLDCFQAVPWWWQDDDDWPSDRWPHSWCIFSVRDEASLYKKPSTGARARHFLTGKMPQIPAREMTPQWVVDIALRVAYAVDEAWDGRGARCFMDPSDDMHLTSSCAVWCMLHDALVFIGRLCDEADPSAAPGGEVTFWCEEEDFVETYSTGARITKKWFKAEGLDPASLYVTVWIELMRRHVDRKLGLLDPFS